MRILVVEDDRETSRFYQTALETEGHEVVQAFTASDALQHTGGEFDIVLLDINLQDELTGIEVCRKLRLGNPTMPICMVTVSLDPEDVTASFRGGANGYIVKPFDLDELFARIEELSNPSF